MRRALALTLALALGACGTSPATTARDASVDAGLDAPAVADVADVSDGGIIEDNPPTGPCEVAVVAPPAELGLAPFYRKYLDADGIPVLGSAVVSDAALRAACRIVRAMTGARTDVRDEMVARGARVAVMARTEVTTDIPEHADLNQAFPGTDWNARARGLGGTVSRPVTSCAEENLLCETADRYRGESILAHELTHGIYNLGAVWAIPSLEARLDAAYRAARAAGRWDRTYAATNTDEYLAEGAQSYFDTNIRRETPDGIHNNVSTRAELAAYDRALHDLVAELFPGLAALPICRPR